MSWAPQAHLLFGTCVSGRGPVLRAGTCSHPAIPCQHAQDDGDLEEDCAPLCLFDGRGFLVETCQEQDAFTGRSNYLYYAPCDYSSVYRILQHMPPHDIGDSSGPYRTLIGE